MEAKLELELEKLLSLEEEYWKIGQGFDWLMQEDRNTAQFHHNASQRLKWNSIDSIADSNGNMITDSTGIEHGIVQYLQYIYTFNNSLYVLQDDIIDKVLSNEEVTSLARMFTLEEILKAKRR